MELRTLILEANIILSPTSRTLIVWNGEKSVFFIGVWETE